MNVNRLVKELNRYAGHYRVEIVYPNTEQSWAPYLVLYSGNVVQAEIHLNDELKSLGT